jgi:hypothetical protein
MSVVNTLPRTKIRAKKGRKTFYKCCGWRDVLTCIVTDYRGIFKTKKLTAVFQKCRGLLKDRG